MCGSMVDSQSATAENRRGKNKKERRNKKPRDENNNGIPYWAAIIKVHNRLQLLNGVELFYLLI